MLVSFCDALYAFACVRYDGIGCVFMCLLYTDKAPSEDVKPILTKHASIIFYVVYASFTSLETTIYDRCEVTCLSLLETSKMWYGTISGSVWGVYRYGCFSVPVLTQRKMLEYC